MPDFGTVEYGGVEYGGSLSVEDAAASPAVVGEGFTFLLCDVFDGDVIEELPFTAFDWTETLNRDGSWSGSFPSYVRQADLSLLDPNAVAVYVDHAGILRFGGMLDMVELSGDESWGLRLAGDGFLSYYDRRTVQSRQGMTFATGTAPSEVIWTGVDAFRIVSDLIAHAAYIAGDANIGFDAVRYRGPGVGGISNIPKTKTVYGYERKSILQLIQELASTVPGFDFSVTVEWDQGVSPARPRRYLDLWVPRRGVEASGTVLEHGTNVTVLRLTRDGGMQANPVTAVGAGTADAQITAVAVDSSYLNPTGSYPYLEGAVEFRDWGVEYAGNLTARANSRLAWTRQPYYTASAKVVEEGGTRLGDVSVGDSLRTVAEIENISYDEWMRCVQMKVAVKDLGLDSWSIELANNDASLGAL